MGTNGPASALVTAAALVSLVSIGCGEMGFLQDPLHGAEVAALGPEDPAVPTGPLHRPGQPCAACHRPGGVAEPYVFAGTVYRDPMERIPVADVAVTLLDSAGNTFSTTTNCSGNFYVRPSELQPVFPTWVSIQMGDLPWNMESPIHREASCARCHFDPVGPASAGHVFLTDIESTFPTIPLRACRPEDGVTR